MQLNFQSQSIMKHEDIESIYATFTLDSLHKQRFRSSFS